MVRFIDREYELQELEKIWERDTAALIIIYGRRRVGKSRLIQEFLRSKEGLYYIADDTNRKIQLDELRKRLADYLNDSFLRTAKISEWRELFEYLGNVLPKDKRFCLAIDEFSYLVKSDPSITSSLQKFWDTTLSNSKTVLVLSGSLFGLMSEQVLSAASPLYGRRTKDFLLAPLAQKDASLFLADFGPEDRLKAYFSIGGIPEYLLKAAVHKSSDDFFAHEFFAKDGYFYREPYYLLSQEFKEIKTYFSMLNAISYGNSKPVDIANFCGIKARELYPYLENLLRLNFIRREVSLFGKRQNGIYSIKDTLFDFWFNFVYPRREDIEKNIFSLERNKLSTYCGKRFESYVRDEVVHFILPFRADQIGRWWHKENEIDAIAFSESSQDILFAECKWSEKVDAKQVLASLRVKTPLVQWHNETRHEHFAIFAKSFKRKEDLGGNVRLYDLKDILKAAKPKK